MLTPIQISYTIDALGRKRPKGRPSNWLLNKPKAHGWPQFTERGIDGIYGITRPVVDGVHRVYKYGKH